jgi:hypothetical protein
MTDAGAENNDDVESGASPTVRKSPRFAEQTPRIDYSEAKVEQSVANSEMAEAYISDSDDDSSNPTDLQSQTAGPVAVPRTLDLSRQDTPKKKLSVLGTLNDMRFERQDIPGRARIRLFLSNVRLDEGTGTIWAYLGLSQGHRVIMEMSHLPRLSKRPEMVPVIAASKTAEGRFYDIDNLMVALGVNSLKQLQVLILYAYMLAGEAKVFGFEGYTDVYPRKFGDELHRLCDRQRDHLRGSSASSIWSMSITDGKSEADSFRIHSATSSVSDRATPSRAVSYVSNGRIARYSSEPPVPLPQRAARSVRLTKTRTASSEPTATRKTNPLAARRGLKEEGA